MAKGCPEGIYDASARERSVSLTTVVLLVRICRQMTSLLNLSRDVPPSFSSTLMRAAARAPMAFGKRQKRSFRHGLFRPNLFWPGGPEEWNHGCGPRSRREIACFLEWAETHLQALVNAAHKSEVLSDIGLPAWK